MHIVIPMSGIGKRFAQAGYKEHKALIEVDGMPIIEHVVNLFPGETKFTFICNEEHLATTPMRQVLQRVAPYGTIVPIAPHSKGPVFAVSQVLDLLDDDEEVIVNYCDFSMYWDYKDFLRHTRLREADGAVPAYRGFHPHMLGSTNYAFMREDGQWLLEIKEKEPFTQNRMQEYASVGTYYFRKGKLVKEYFPQLMEKEICVNGEFYVSMVYSLMLQSHLPVSIYEVQHMLQWGTPQDLAEYNQWSAYFRAAAAAQHPAAQQTLHAQKGINLIPLAGRGSRFTQEGYTLPKPLIPVSGKPMIVQACDSLPKAKEHVFVCLKEHLEVSPLQAQLEQAYEGAKVITIDQVTEGQACTCMIGLANCDLEAPLLIGACDNGMLWNTQKWQTLCQDSNVDVIVWSFKGHISSKLNPHMYGWLRVDEQNNVLGASVKVPISQDPINDHAIVGTFYFKKGRYFMEAFNQLYKNNCRVNNEFYVDSCINTAIELGLHVKVFQVDQYICWGTPNDYKTFEYWQSFFHKCSWHPYELQKDPTVAPEAVAQLDARYHAFSQKFGEAAERRVAPVARV